MDFGSPETWRWIWLIAAVAFTVGEIAVAGSFFLLPFGAGALAGAVITLLGGSVALGWLGFVGVSAASSAVLWPLGRRLDRRTPTHAIGPTAGWAARATSCVTSPVTRAAPA